MRTPPDQERLENDRKLLTRVIGHEDLSEEEMATFTSMLERSIARDLPLSEKQRAWVEDVARKLGIVEPSLNLWSSGRVPRGAEVPTPAILLNRPLKPPGRK